MQMLRICVISGAVVAAAAMGCSIAAAETQVIEHSFITTGSSALVAAIDNGSIEVVSNNSGGNAIQVTATVRNPDRVDYRVLQDGNTVSVISKSDEGFDFFGGGGSGVDLLVSVPRETDLEVESSNGAIVVTGITGLISGKASNGDVSITDSNGDIEIRTSNGRVALVDVSGQVQAQTSNGSISYSGTLRPGSANELQTSNGSIEVALVDTPGVEIAATTSNGRVSSSLPMTIGGEVKDNELKGTIGEGGSSLDISTSNGSISIK
jgi:hypothetical protein